MNSDGTVACLMYNDLASRRVSKGTGVGEQSALLYYREVSGGRIEGMRVEKKVMVSG
jgi:hypothetical protein